MLSRSVAFCISWLMVASLVFASPALGETPGADRSPSMDAAYGGSGGFKEPEREPVVPVEPNPLLTGAEAADPADAVDALPGTQEALEKAVSAREVVPTGAGWEAIGDTGVRVRGEDGLAKSMESVKVRVTEEPEGSPDAVRIEVDPGVGLVSDRAPSEHFPSEAAPKSAAPSEVAPSAAFPTVKRPRFSAGPMRVAAL